MRRGISICALAPLCGLLIGCGGEQTLTASEFVDRVGEQGVALELGEELPTSGGAEHLYAVEVPPGAGGSLYVFSDTEGASEQLGGCRGSGGLLCYRAANIVVVLDEESGATEAHRLAVAIRKLGES